MPQTTARTALTALGAVGAVGAAAAVWGIGIERYLFTVRWHEIPVLPAGAEEDEEGEAAECPSPCFRGALHSAIPPAHRQKISFRS